MGWNVNSRIFCNRCFSGSACIQTDRRKKEKICLQKNSYTATTYRDIPILVRMTNIFVSAENKDISIQTSSIQKMLIVHIMKRILFQ